MHLYIIRFGWTYVNHDANIMISVWVMNKSVEYFEFIFVVRPRQFVLCLNNSYKNSSQGISIRPLFRVWNGKLNSWRTERKNTLNMIINGIFVLSKAAERHFFVCEWLCIEERWVYAMSFWSQCRKRKATSKKNALKCAVPMWLIVGANKIDFILIVSHSRDNSVTKILNKFT